MKRPHCAQEVPSLLQAGLNFCSQIPASELKNNSSFFLTAFQHCLALAVLSCWGRTCYQTAAPGITPAWTLHPARLLLTGWLQFYFIHRYLCACVCIYRHITNILCCS